MTAASEHLLEVDQLRVEFPIRTGVFRRTTGVIRAVDNVSFTIDPGQTLGLVGESGSGKSTIARSIVRVNAPTHGAIRLDGRDLLGLGSVAMREMRRQVQMIFQDPYASLNPRHTVAQILAEPLRVHQIAEDRRTQRTRSIEFLETVGLSESSLGRYPHEFSGGQRQRIGIARALAVSPKLLICDEPVSALDVSVQAQIINLLSELQASRGVAYLFIAHDLAVVRQLAHAVAVMYLGQIVEYGPGACVYEHPLHPYTRALMSAAPIPDARIERTRARTILVGDMPSVTNRPLGCAFHTRCPLRRQLGNPEICHTVAPPLKVHAPAGPSHAAACHFVGQTDVRDPSSNDTKMIQARP